MQADTHRQTSIQTDRHMVTQYFAPVVGRGRSNSIRN